MILRSYRSGAAAGRARRAAIERAAMVGVDKMRRGERRMVLVHIMG